MQTFKKCTYFILFNSLIFAILTFTLSQPSFLKATLAEAKQDDFQVLIVGQSHSETSIDPYLLGEKISKQAFNLSRRCMPLQNLYYLIAEANKDKHATTVILDIDPVYWTGEEEITPGLDTNLISLLTGTRRSDYFFDVICQTNFAKAVGDYSDSALKKIPETLKAKLSYYQVSRDEYISHVNDWVGTGKTYNYIGRGFRYGIKYSGIDWPSPLEFRRDCVKASAVQVFQKIVHYCEQNNIRLVCIQSALPPYRIQSENVDAVHDYFTELCFNYGVPFYDFNYVKREYLGQSDSDYVDLDGHMMGQLAERHTAIIAEVLCSDSPENYFYTSYDDVLQHIS